MPSDPRGSGSKGAKKPDRASPIGLHKQIGLNCTGCGPSTAGRATAVPMARQRSGRQKPRNTHIASMSVMAWKHETAIRGGKARLSLLPGSRRDPRWDWLLCPISRIARGRAHRLTAQRLEIGTRELGSFARSEAGLAATARYGRHQGRSFRSSRSAGKPHTGRREAGRR
jgi:hypothetical protein